MAEIGERISVRCACGAKLNAPLSAVGKVAPCPRCQAPLTVPSPDEVDFGAAPEEFDYSMSGGIRKACIAGAIAAGISVGIGVMIEGELIIMACVIGFACGIGMLLGTKRRAPECGIIAAGITAAAVLLSKVGIFLVLSAGHPGGADRDLAVVPDPSQTQKDAHMLMVDEYLSQHEDDDGFSLDQAHTQAKERLAKMTPEQQRAYIKAREAAFDKESGDPSGTVVGTVSFLLMFGMYDIIFFVGGLAAAYFTATFNDQ